MFFVCYYSGMELSQQPLFVICEKIHGFFLISEIFTGFYEKNYI